MEAAEVEEQRETSPLLPAEAREEEVVVAVEEYSNPMTSTRQPLLNISHSSDALPFGPQTNLINSNSSSSDSDDDVILDTGAESSRLPIQQPTGTILSSCINIINTILGAGMLAMPNAIADVGLGLGIVLIGFCASASAFGLFLLARIAVSVVAVD